MTLISKQKTNFKATTYLFVVIAVFAVVFFVNNDRVNACGAYTFCDNTDPDSPACSGETFFPCEWGCAPATPLSCPVTSGTWYCYVDTCAACQSDGSCNGGFDNCNNPCSTPTPMYLCDGGGSCVRDDANGTFTSSNCNNTCRPPGFCGDGSCAGSPWEGQLNCGIDCPHTACLPAGAPYPNGLCTLVYANGADGCSPENSVCGTSVTHYSCSGSSCVVNSNGIYTEPTCNSSCGGIPTPTPSGTPTPTPTPTLSTTLTASPNSGNSPLSVNLTSNVFGNAAGTVNYSFWWNCANNTTSVATATTACGALPSPAAGSCAVNSTGAKCLAIPPTVPFRSASQGSAASGVLSLTLNKPAGTVVNSFLVAAITVRPMSATITPPAGWTLLRRLDNPGTGSGTNTLATYYKLAGSSEPANYTWSFSVSSGAAGGILEFQQVDLATPINVESGQNTPSGLTHTAPSVTTTILNTRLVTIHSFSSSATWTPQGIMTERVDVASMAVPNVDGISLEMNTDSADTPVGVTGTRTSTASGNADIGNTQTIALWPAPQQTVSNTYTSTSLAKVIVERGAAPPAQAQTPVSINSTPAASNVTITVPDYCVSGAAVTISWTYSDSGNSPQSAYQVQIDDQGSYANPEIDSGKITSSSTAWFSGQGSLQLNTVYHARVRVWNGADFVSPWALASLCFGYGCTGGGADSWKTVQYSFPQTNFTWNSNGISENPSPPLNKPVNFIDQTVFQGPVNGRRWDWVFGDGVTSVLQNPSHTYAEGVYYVTLTATDNANNSCPRTRGPIYVQKPIPLWIEVAPR